MAWPAPITYAVWKASLVTGRRRQMPLVHAMNVLVPAQFNNSEAIPNARRSLARLHQHVKFHFAEPLRIGHHLDTHDLAVCNAKFEGGERPASGYYGPDGADEAIDDGRLGPRRSPGECACHGPCAAHLRLQIRSRPADCRAVRAQHSIRIEQRHQGIEVTSARGG